MNGSQDHRQRRVPATNWMVLIGIIAAVFALGSTLSKGAGPEMLGRTTVSTMKGGID